MNRLGTLTLICWGLIAFSPVGRAGSAPRLLPPASDLHLTLREDRQSRLLSGPSCRGEAALTLTCRAFVLTLENASSHTIHLSGLTCKEPDIRIERREPRSSNGWWPVTLSRKSACKSPLVWTNLRVGPYERTEYVTRLVNEWHDGETFAPGTYTLRATWVLQGCTEAIEGTDCLHALQMLRPPNSVWDIDMQEPVSLVSNEISVEAPQLPDLGTIKFDLAVKILPTPPRADSPREADCSAQSQTSVDCIFFHSTIRNVGNRAIRYVISTCGHSLALPEYRVGDSQWQYLPQRPLVCAGTVRIEIVILPGKTFEGDSPLSTLTYDVTPFSYAGKLRLRFTTWPSACFASDDGSFCLAPAVLQQQLVSPEIEITVP